MRVFPGETGNRETAEETRLERERGRERPWTERSEIGKDQKRRCWEREDRPSAERDKRADGGVAVEPATGLCGARTKTRREEEPTCNIGFLLFVVVGFFFFFIGIRDKEIISCTAAQAVVAAVAVERARAHTAASCRWPPTRVYYYSVQYKYDPKLIFITPFIILQGVRTYTIIL